MSECYISVDIETTGPTPGLYSMFEIGAAVVHRRESYFTSTLTPLPNAGFLDAALHAIGKTRNEIFRPDFGSEPARVLSAFADWVRTQSRNGERVVFVANNAPFDWMFIAWYFEKFHIENPFGHSALDMKAYFMGLTGCTWADATLRNMATHAMIPFVSLPHRALCDAQIQAEIFSKLISKESS